MKEAHAELIVAFEQQMSCAPTVPVEGPLHEALGGRHPEPVVLAILEAYPAAAQKRYGGGRLPVHEALAMTYFLESNVGLFVVSRGCGVMAVPWNRRCGGRAQ